MNVYIQCSQQNRNKYLDVIVLGWLELEGIADCLFFVYSSIDEHDTKNSCEATQ